MSAEYSPYFPEYKRKSLNIQNSEEVANSLNPFLSSYSKEGLQGLVAAHTISGKTVDEEQFVLTSHIPGIKYSRVKSALFYMDGYNGFGLGVKHADDVLPIAAISLHSSTKVNGYTPDEPFSAVHPMIVQLQGPANDTYTDKRHYPVALAHLQSIRWEPLLVDVVKAWAIQENLPALSIRSAEFNPYAISCPKDVMDRFKKRYNFTAKKSGFTKQPNGFYSLALR